MNAAARGRESQRRRTDRRKLKLSAVAVSSLGFSSIFYFAVEGFINRSASAFAFYAFTLFLYSSGACLATLAFATPLPSVEVALAATALFQFGNCLLIGFLIPVSRCSAAVARGRDGAAD